MSYLNFDKTLLINLERSLNKEMIRTNRAGAYNSTTLVDCNTRKYHGQLVLPLGDPLPQGNYVLLGSLDETVIQHGAEFNLGIHQYGENIYMPNGHKYIREFDCEVISKTTYRVGGVILTKERMLVSFEPRVLIRYTLVEAHSPTILRLKPFLAYRNTNELTHENGMACSDMREVENGRAARMYDQFPELFMQCSKKVEYIHAPAWYKGIEYLKEQERGFSYKEDQLVPGWFEMSIKKGESVIFAAGISEVNPKTLKALWEKELKRRSARDTMFGSLKNAASQFYKREGDKCYLLAGYPWFKSSAREEFLALPGCTMGIGRPEYWEAIVDKTAVEEIRHFMEGKPCKLVGMDEPDVLLWFIHALQEYAAYTSIEEVTRLYGELIIDIMLFIRRQQHPRVFLHNNGLLWVDGKDRPATWMNAVEDGRPITPRTGYVVELNALWYNARLFTAAIQRCLGKEQIADLMEYQAEITKDSFVKTFWNGMYLDDYVDGDYHNKEVRPNQIIAASLPYSPLDRRQCKAVVDICTKELYTPKGLRTISPKSGSYRPEYIGGQLERDRNFHNGPVWPWTIAAYAIAYLKVYQHSGESFIRRLLTGYEAEMSELCIGTLNELYDGNPPFKGHGGMSYAPSVASVIEVCNTLKQYEEK
jgi:predicted glycogen debranching enzyme